MNYIPITQISKNSNNPRIIKDDGFKKLKESLSSPRGKEHFESRPCIVSTRTGENIIIAGNTRYQAAVELGWKEVPVFVIPDLTLEQEQEIIIRDNVSNGEWDWSMLANEWDSEKLQEWGLDVPDIETIDPEVVEDDYEVPDTIKTDIVLGDLIEIGEHRLLCGDSTSIDAFEKLMDGEKADISFTSPPYNGNTGFNTGKNKGKLYDNFHDNETSEDYVLFCSTVLSNCMLYTADFVFWNVSYNANSKFEFIQQIVCQLHSLTETICWKKNSIPTLHGLNRCWEPIFVFKCGNVKRLSKDGEVVHNLWEIESSGSQIGSHRACYPVQLPTKAILITEALKVFDPFLGSGTTMVASHQLKRKCYGIELDPKYCQVIVDRMKKLDPTLVIKRNGELWEI